MKSTLTKNLSILLVASLLASTPLLAEEKKAEPVKSHNFIAFDEAAYNTSPDKRIGAKILVDTTKVGPSIAAMTHLTYLPGAHISSHRHVYVTEILYVLEGNLTVRIGNEKRIIGKDSTAFIPPKTFHEYMNDSLDVVKFLQYYSPSGAEEEYRNWDNNKTAETKAIAEELKKEQERKNRGPEYLDGPKQITVPGSPTEVTLGDVKIEEPKERVEEDASKEEKKEATNEKGSTKLKELLLNLKTSKTEK